MIWDILHAIGGLGAFLLGISLLVEGLKGLAGPALRRSLARFTYSPLSGAVTGAAATAVLQSSSAVTVTAVGFVSASLITFPQALGIIFGANVGTTATGWIVSLVGFKLDLAAMLAPAVFLGVMLRSFGTGKVRQAGGAIAGFGLMFAGLAAMQLAMSGFAGYVSPASFPADTVMSRLQMTAIGIVMAAVMQSSSAGVATALVALSAGAISFPQAAAFVIGLDIGTTITALLATIGGSAATRRTGLAHLVFNLMTGALAFAMLPLWVGLAGNWIATGDARQAHYALVGFHTWFNVIGAVIGIGLAGPFARLLMRLVPGEDPSGVQRFDRALLAEPQAAIEPLTAAAREISRRTLDALDATLDPSREPPEPAVIAAIANDQGNLENALALMRTSPEQGDLHQRHVTILHALDHAARLLARLGNENIAALLRSSGARAYGESLRPLAQKLAAACAERGPAGLLERAAEACFENLENEYRTSRLQVIAEASQGRMDLKMAMDQLDALRWAGRAAYHMWRMTHHLERAHAFERPLAKPQLHQGP